MNFCCRTRPAGFSGRKDRYKIQENNVFCKKCQKIFFICFHFIFLPNPKQHVMRAIALSALFFLSVLAVSAQPRALGVRLGTECQLSYEHGIGTDFVEVDFGYELINLVNLAGAYNFMIAQPEWTKRGEWGFYAGPAVKVGGAGVGFYLALGAQAGLEYSFEFPLQISLDVRPTVGAAFVNGSASFYGGGAIFGGLPCLSVRYRFGR